MQPTDWINAATHLGPYIVAVVGVIAWGFKNRPSAEERRQTELLARLVAKSDKA